MLSMSTHLYFKPVRKLIYFPRILLFVYPRNLIGLNVDMALCYAKMDYPVVAYNLVKNYLRSFPNSPFAKNLLLSILYHTITTKTTIEEKSDLARNLDKEGTSLVPEMEAMLKQKLYPEVEYLCRHNLVLFKECETALQVLPSLMKHVPEARLNLMLYHLKRGIWIRILDWIIQLDSFQITWKMQWVCAKIGNQQLPTNSWWKHWPFWDLDKTITR